MNYRISKRTIFTSILSVLFAVCVMLGICLLTSTATGITYAYAEDNYSTHETTDHNNSKDWQDLNKNINYSKGGSISSGTYYLSGDLDLTQADCSDITIPADVTVTLCLNGYALIGTGKSSVITVEKGGTLYLYDCREGEVTNYLYYDSENKTYNYCSVAKDTTCTCTNSHTSHVAVDSGVITGGAGQTDTVLSNNTGTNVTHAGGVFVKGTFVMYGGTIAGNTAGRGAGVLLYGNCTTNTAHDNIAKFTMRGGAIAYNTTDSTSGYGGGVYVAEDSLFTMHAGTINSNLVTNNEGKGGGVLVDGSTENSFGGHGKQYTQFIMLGGTISNNMRANGSSASQLYVQYGLIEIHDGTVGSLSASTVAAFGISTDSGAEIAIYGGYISSAALSDSKITIYGGYFTVDQSTCKADTTTCARTGSDGWAYVVYSSHTHSNGDCCSGTYDKVITKYSSGTIGDGSTAQQLYYYLISDVELDLTITKNTTVYLCLYGYSITGSGSGSVITVEDGATLYLCDCGTNSAGNEVSVSEDQTQTFSVGVITGGSATNGGGIYVAGTLNMCNGAIVGNTAESGGGVYVADGGSFEMTGGEITANTASAGGGVFVGSNGSFEMTGGEITANTASAGGGVFLYGSKFTMSGSTAAITGNYATQGAGVYMLVATLEMSAGKIDGNCVSTSDATELGIYNLGGSFEMSNGYFGGSIVNSAGTVLLTGGYFDQTAYDSAANCDYFETGKGLVSADSGVTGYCEYFPYTIGAVAVTEGESESAHTHNYTWCTNSLSHVYVCTECLTMSEGSFGEHVYDDDEDETCNTCGYTRTLAEDDTCTEHEGTWSYNADSHIQVCLVCNTVIEGTYGSHSMSSWSDNGDGTHSQSCSVCGYTVTAAHSGDSETCADCGGAIEGGSTSDSGNGKILWWLAILLGIIIVGAVIILIVVLSKRKARS